MWYEYMARRHDNNWGRMPVTSSSNTDTDDENDTDTDQHKMADDPPPPYDAPPSYSSVVRGFCHVQQTSAAMTVVDFLPELPSVRFPTLIERANDWLRTNRAWEVKTCETVEMKSKGGIPQVACVTFLEHTTATTFVLGLRLWLVPRRNLQMDPQQIGYFNVVPNKVVREFKVQFERLDTVMNDLNTRLTDTPIEGRIITVETQAMKYSTRHGAVDPDRCYFTDFGFSVFVIRIFYELGPRAYESIGVIDFFPDLNRSNYYASETFRLVPHMVSLASSWCQHEEDIFICKLQTIPMKMKEDRTNRVDDMKMSIREDRCHNYQTKYMRILRLFYVKATGIPRDPRYPPLFTTGIITCKTFLPVQLTDGSTLKPEFETTEKSLTRISEWVKAFNVNVISAETCPIVMYPDREENEGPDATCFYNRHKMGERYIIVIRLYMCGDYPDPDANMCPVAYHSWKGKPIFSTSNGSAEPEECVLS